MIQETATRSNVEKRSEESVVDMSIVLVCWNNKAYLDPCLKSLYDGGLKSSFDVVVVDNGSTDGSQKMLAEKYPQVKLIQNAGNVGLGKASNQGIEATNGRHVLLLNNDTLVNAPALDVLVEYLDAHPKAGATAGRLLNPDGSFQSGFAPFSTLLEEFLIVTHIGELLWAGYPSHGDAQEIKETGWMSSACLLVRRTALDQIGLLDEGYFIYGDEADLQYRLNKAGWKVVFLPNSSIVHFGGRSMDRWKRRKMVYRGKMMFYKKNYGFVSAFFLRVLFFFMSLVKLLVWVVGFVIPSKNDQAKKELRSNIDVMALCLNLK
ncbi:MAG TPA: glycosyltransferase family 2 protein [Anaerolineales bacterium]|mgnify:CR=1 FL=1|nr:glycosyltransferase family 2 protein [Anaerolineales bacterium]HMR98885.1 glycosyltransferase family 2 protein [Anaerolineales bacterium]HNQ93274.1 glycosyltransferase family 2 protein [Anaerolineales bacterium]HNS60280.1 glycosyltransferase family 2 protein [Anaerolineales bacterium]